MNQNLLFVAKAIGDLKVSINGETRVGFSVKDVWTNFVNFEIMGDQGNLYRVTDQGNGAHALFNLKILLSVIDVVPYGNDQANSRFVTEDAKLWLRTKAFDKIKEGLCSHDNVFKVTAQYKEKGEPVISLTAEIMVNKYVKSMLHLIERTVFIGAPSFKVHEGETLPVDENQQPLTGPVLFKPFGLEQITCAKYYYRLNINPNDTSLPTHIFTKDEFDFKHPRGTRAITVS